ncbi:hypothetical protein AK830_g1598 [Neonectria ditissima]|uniref:Uncharacterized protein n=1 Tax=Neonectria ditissima TaxID=78410 RepID=A0A0N8H8L1_9HYPO|nr:hypothetical protein AK830_g1598 [Neonectria ditissima]
MEPSTETSRVPQLHHESPSNTALQVDFSWKKFKALITEKGKSNDPVYVVHFQTIKSPSILFKSANGTTIGSGTLHPISINADYAIHGQKGTLKALKRFQTEYTHLSYAYSDSEEPATMRWTSNCGFKTWDFVCLDQNELPVAKFSANAWAINKIGKIEFLGPKATSQAARDEIVVTGLTLFYCMTLRSTSILSFFGAIFARPGPLKKETEQQSGAKHPSATTPRSSSSSDDESNHKPTNEVPASSSSQPIPKNKSSPSEAPPKDLARAQEKRITSSAGDHAMKLVMGNLIAS